MEFQDALKQVTTKRDARNNFLTVNFGYHLKLVLPFNDGMALIKALENAEQLKDPYASVPQMDPLDKSSVEFGYMAQEDYRRYKIANLMNLSYDEVKSIEKNGGQSTN